VTVALSGATQADEVAQSVRGHKAEDDVRSQLGHRVAVSADGPDVYLSAATEDRTRRRTALIARRLPSTR